MRWLVYAIPWCGDWYMWNLSWCGDWYMRFPDGVTGIWDSLMRWLVYAIPCPDAVTGIYMIPCPDAVNGICDSLPWCPGVVQLLIYMIPCHGAITVNRVPTWSLFPGKVLNLGHGSLGPGNVFNSINVFILMEKLILSVGWKGSMKINNQITNLWFHQLRL